jgi:hypothetical protein
MANETNLRDIIKKEYAKCALDPEYFLKKYCYIQVPIKGRQLFNLYNYQTDTLQTLQEDRYNIILKGRQIGITTLVAGYCMWRLLFKTDEEILVIAIQQDVAKTLVTRVKFMHQELPSWLQGQMDVDNQLGVRFANGSSITAKASNDHAGRSDSLSLLILDEAAHIENATDIWTAAQATLSTTGGSAILMSTPNGMGNFFHKTWIGADEGENDFSQTKLDWRVLPDRTEAWAEEQLRALGPMRFAQEHEASFLFSGNTVISPEIIEFYKETFQQEPLEKRGFDRNFWVWEQPDYTRSYIVSADIARGDDLDYSTAHVIDIESSTQVAEYKGKLPTGDFGNLLVQIATEYNDALIIPENATVGWAVIQRILDRNYQNLFYMSKDLKYVDTHHQVNNNFRADDKRMVPGFTMSQRTRPLVIAKLESYMRDQSIIIRSNRMLTELETFIWKNGKAQAMDGYNDDLTMALAIGLWVRDTALRLKAEGVELQRSMIDNISTATVPAIFTGKGTEDPYKITINGHDEDLRWLL